MNMRAWKMAALLLVMAALATGCASSKGSSRNTGLWIAMYPVNRVLDVLDVVSFSAGLEGGLYANAHVTRAVQLGLGGGGGFNVGWWQKRELGADVDTISGLALGPFMLETENLSRAGTRGGRVETVDITGVCVPGGPGSDERDYWGIGARAIVLLVGAEVEVHPVELADAITGFFFIDFMHDDIGNGR